MDQPVSEIEYVCEHLADHQCIGRTVLDQQDLKLLLGVHDYTRGSVTMPNQKSLMLRTTSMNLLKSTGFVM